MERVQVLREISEQSQRRFAVAAGISFSSVQVLEKSGNPISAKLAGKISKATGVSAEWLKGSGNADKPVDWQGRTYTVETFKAHQRGKILPPQIGEVWADVLTLSSDEWEESLRDFVNAALARSMRLRSREEVTDEAMTFVHQLKSKDDVIEKKTEVIARLEAELARRKAELNKKKKTG